MTNYISTFPCVEPEVGLALESNAAIPARCPEDLRRKIKSKPGRRYGGGAVDGYINEDVVHDRKGRDIELGGEGTCPRQPEPRHWGTARSLRAPE